MQLGGPRVVGAVVLGFDAGGRPAQSNRPWKLQTDSKQRHLLRQQTYWSRVGFCSYSWGSSAVAAIFLPGRTQESQASFIVSRAFVFIRYSCTRFCLTTLNGKIVLDPETGGRMVGMVGQGTWKGRGFATGRFDSLHFTLCTLTCKSLNLAHLRLNKNQPNCDLLPLFDADLMSNNHEGWTGHRELLIPMHSLISIDFGQFRGLGGPGSPDWESRHLTPSSVRFYHCSVRCMVDARLMHVYLCMSTFCPCVQTTN